MIEKDLEDFTVHMKHKLLVHKNKGGYERLTLQELKRMLKGEVKELDNSLANENYPSSIRECADIANYAMMIAVKIQNRRVL